MKQLNLYYLGGGGGGGTVPNGATVEPTDDIQIWLHCADIWDKDYTNLAEVLADTETLTALISSHNAVDYMVRSTTWATRSALVPKMTSDITPSGIASASSVLNASTYAYSAFDETETPWISAGNAYDSNFVQYVFAESVVPSFVEWTCYVDSNTNRQELNLKGAEDGINYSDVLLNVAESSYADKKKFFYEIPNTKAYRGFRAYSNVNLYGGQWFGAIRELQFYSASIPTSNKAMLLIGANNYAANTLLGDSTWLAAICDSDYYSNVLNVSVPEMTSNTEPSGVASASSSYGTGYEAFRAFRNDGTVWAAVDSDKNGWVQYMFPEAVHVYMIYQKTLSTGSLSRQFKVFDLTGSNDGNTWTNLGRYDNKVTTSDIGTILKSAITSNGTYKYYRCTGVQNRDSLNLCGATGLNFYGRKDI